MTDNILPFEGIMFEERDIEEMLRVCAATMTRSDNWSDDILRARANFLHRLATHLDYHLPKIAEELQTLHNWKADYRNQIEGLEKNVWIRCGAIIVELIDIGVYPGIGYDGDAGYDAWAFLDPPIEGQFTVDQSRYRKATAPTLLEALTKLLEEVKEII